jgi:ABC-type uncharacterized transport system permease subunit
MTILVLATLLLYLASFASYVWNLSTKRTAVGITATACLVGALICHYYALLERAHAMHAVPYEDLWGSLSLFAWLLAATYLSLECVHRQRSVGPFVLPIVIVLFALSHLREAIPHVAPARGPLFALHVTLNILAYSAFALAFILSIIFVIQNQVLRRHKLGLVFWRFPAMDTLEWMTRSAVVVGIIAMCAGAAFGFVWAHRLRGHYWNGDPKEIVTILLLLIYGAYLWLSRTPSWRGARASVLCIANFFLVIFSYSIVNIYMSRYHRFY